MKHEQMTVGRGVNGHAKASIEYRGRHYNGIITDMTLVDAYHEEKRGWKKAAAAMYDMIKRQNGVA